MKDEWTLTLVGGATIDVDDAQTGGIARITVPTNATGDQGDLWWNDVRSLLLTKKLTMETRVKIGQTTLLGAFISLVFDWNNYVRFQWSSDTWDINHENDGAGPTIVDSGVAVDASYHIFRIECHTHGANHVHFYIDGTETANSPITTNIPDDATDFLQPRFTFWTTETAQKTMDIDYVVIRQEI